MKQPERDNRIKKYGGWAMNISDTEAEEIFRNYSAGMPLLKQMLRKLLVKTTLTMLKQIVLLLRKASILMFIRNLANIFAAWILL